MKNSRSIREMKDQAKICALSRREDIPVGQGWMLSERARKWFMCADELISIYSNCLHQPGTLSLTPNEYEPKKNQKLHANSTPKITF